MTPSEFRNIVFARLPPIDDHGDQIEALLPDGVVVRLPYDDSFVGSETWGGNTVKVISGPLVMGLADTAMYAACLAVAGIDTVAVVVSMTTTFLRPASEADLLAEAVVRRRGGRLAYLDCTIRSDGTDEPVAHIVATYALRRR